ncbi:hypothetical protein QBC46DRAFT_314648 [Diplogelasinospora grovesii]|uniref:Uncharacterized protein n=1 Tax=Diplogelasinospora grovesii TaxID=303347 RepID=A0AAN6N6B8_9PEZI|nr:hypothetical protein QBC46DRAFT_314648 [Diplogelasinospora grovesii]
MSNYTIQTGVIWVNHDTSPALGATLTVTIRWGNYLIAALSSLVAWAGAGAWSIAAYVLHQRLAAVRDKDVLHQQLQVHFRTAGSFCDSWIDGLSLHRAWRGRPGVRQVKRRTLAVSLLALVVFLIFTAAGVFVAEVATKSYQDVLVLAAPSDCGDFVFVTDNTTIHSALVDVVTGYQNDANFWARNYARDAYHQSRSRESAFALPSLPYTGYEVPCPYNNGTACFGPNQTADGSAWRMETGPLNSHIHFGMNAPQQDRVTWATTATCAVVDPANLTIAPYWRIDNYHGHEVNNTYIGILQQFGPDLGYDSNLMFEIPANLMYERTGFFSQRGLWFPGIADGDGKAITGYPFNRTDADMAMITTTQGLMFYYAPVDDPYFFAHQAVTGDEQAIDLNTTVYYPSNLFGLMVCTEQQQICDPNTHQCTPWSGLQRLENAVYNNTLGLKDAQLATAMRIMWTIRYIGSMLPQAAHGTTNLLIAEENGARGGSSVPPNQWMKEVELWFAANLAGIQNSLLQWVAKPWPQGHPETMYGDFVNLTASDTMYADYNVTSQMNTLCKNQLIRSNAAVQNFSVLALLLVIVLCVLIIATAFLLPVCVNYSRNRRMLRKGSLSRAAEAGRIARLADGKYSVLAMALQGAGIGIGEKESCWVVGQDEIPVTKGPVPVHPPVERNGLASYPTYAVCMGCRGKTEAENSGEKRWKKPTLRVYTTMEPIEEDSPGKLDRRETEQTLVSSPVEQRGKGTETKNVEGGHERLSRAASGQTLVVSPLSETFSGMDG